MSLRDQIASAYRVVLESSARSPLHFLQHVTIDSVPEPKPYRQVAEPWQWTLAKRLSPAFSYVAGAAEAPNPLNYWLTLPKGHDKSSLIARMCNWALAFSRRSWNGYVAAADKEQAGYLAEAMRTEARLNPWLASRLDFKSWVVRGSSGSKLTILASDAASSQGIRGDLIVFDELTHWTKRDLFDDVMSGAAKRASVVISITNAGIRYSWQHDAVEFFKTSPFWYVYEAPGPLAGWMDAARIADLSRTILPQEARRLYQNEWVDPGEASGYLTRTEIAKGSTLGSSLALSYSLAPTPGLYYVASIDYGAVHDRCVLALLHERRDGTIIVDRLDVWQGSRTNPIQISSVERWLDETRKLYPLSCVVIDPHQMVSTIQRYQGLVPIEEWQPRGGKANYEMAQAFRSALVNDRLAWYPKAGSLLVTDPTTGYPVEETLEDELLMLQLKPMAYGFRVEHLPSRHDDRFVALAMAVAHLHNSRLKRSLPHGDGWF